MGLAIFAFAVMVLIGLLAVGLGADRESRETLLAANMATGMVEMRGLEPLNGAGPSVLPALSLTEDQTGEFFCDELGNEVATANDAQFRVSYEYHAPTDARRLVGVLIEFHWPPVAAAGAAAGGFYKIQTAIHVP